MGGDLETTGGAQIPDTPKEEAASDTAGELQARAGSSDVAVPKRTLMVQTLAELARLLQNLADFCVDSFFSISCQTLCRHSAGHCCRPKPDPRQLASSREGEVYRLWRCV